MTKAQKEQRAKQIQDSSNSFRHFMDLLRKLKITKHLGTNDRWYDYNFLKRMGKTSKSKGALRNES